MDHGPQPDDLQLNRHIVTALTQEEALVLKAMQLTSQRKQQAQRRRQKQEFRDSG